MDQLSTLRNVGADTPGPSNHALARGRALLAQHIAESSPASSPAPAPDARRRSVRWAFVTLGGVTAVVVVVALVLTSLLGVGAWRQNGVSAPATPTPTVAGMIDEAAAVAIALQQAVVSESAVTDARLFTYSDWVAEGEGANVTAIDPSHPVWVVSVLGQANYPHLGPPGSTIAPSLGYTVVIDATTGGTIEFSTAPTTFR